MRVDFEDEEQLDQTTKMVEIGNSIGGHKLTVCLRNSVMTSSVTFALISDPFIQVNDWI